MKKGIDFDKRVIHGKSGKIYKIMPEDISVGRWAEFEIRGWTLAYNTDFETLYKMFESVEDHIMNGKHNAQGNAHNALKEIQEFKNGMVNYQLNKRSKIVEFVSLFTTEKDEDVSIHTEEQIRKKYDDWGHIPVADFFLLCANVIPSFKDILINTLQNQKEKLQSETNMI